MGYTNGRRVISRVTLEEVEQLNAIYGPPFTIKDWLRIVHGQQGATIESRVLLKVFQGGKKGWYRGKMQRPGSIESGITVLLDLLGEAYPCIGELTISEIRQSPNIPGDTALEGEVLTEFLFSDQGFLGWSFKAVHRDGYCSAMDAACKAMQWLIHQKLGHTLTLDVSASQSDQE